MTKHARPEADDAVPLMTCSKCCAELSQFAATCRKCGAANKKNTNRLVQKLAGLVPIIVVSFLASCGEPAADADTAEKHQAVQKRKAKDARLAAMSVAERAAEEKRIAARKEKRQKAAAVAAEERRLAELRRQGLTWNYETYKDDRTGKDVRVAYLTINKLIESDSPHDGAQRAVLTLRYHPHSGQDAMLSVAPRKFSCHVDGCRVAVVFDGKHFELHSASQLANSDGAYLVILDETRLIRSLKSAKRMRISASVYQEGLQTFDFNVANLDWP